MNGWMDIEAKGRRVCFFFLVNDSDFGSGNGL
jgi:hypothetical protein